jgi:hypothetical protein
MNIKQVVKEKYGQAALQVLSGNQASCCCGPERAVLAGEKDPISAGRDGA